MPRSRHVLHVLHIVRPWMELGHDDPCHTPLAKRPECKCYDLTGCLVNTGNRTWESLIKWVENPCSVLNGLYRLTCIPKQGMQTHALLGLGKELQQTIAPVVLSGRAICQRICSSMWRMTWEVSQVSDECSSNSDRVLALEWGYRREGKSLVDTWRLGHLCMQ